MMAIPILVALIDDDQDDYFLIKDLLKSVPETDYRLTWFPDSKSGLEALKSKSFDIYLVDYRLDTVTGLDLLDEIQKQDIKRTIILLTGQGNFATDMAAMNKGASDFIAKANLTSEILERSIRYCIKRAQDQDRLHEAEKIKAAKDALEAASKAKTMFLANMSHEIRTPLNAILGFADLALEKKINDPEINEHLETIKRNGDHLLRLINDILDLSKVETGHMKVNNEIFNWREVVLEAIQMLSPKARDKSLKIKFECSDDIPLLLKTDSHRFRQILINLIGNAIKFTERGTITLLPSLLNSAISKQFCFDVTDSGIGISLDQQAHLFQPFQQANSSLTRTHGGTGLGLDLSRKLAQALEGNLTLHKSETASGSTFRLTLPAKFTSLPLKQFVPAEKTDSQDQRQKKTRVLLVEDTHENQVLVRCYLKNTDFEVDCANDGAQGVQKALNENFDLILMDIQMPILNGYDAVQTLRSQGYKKPIIALTANAFDEDREDAMAKGFSDYVTKPLKKETLISALEQQNSKQL